MIGKGSVEMNAKKVCMILLCYIVAFFMITTSCALGEAIKFVPPKEISEVENERFQSFTEGCLADGVLLGIGDWDYADFGSIITGNINILPFSYYDFSYELRDNEYLPYLFSINLSDASPYVERYYSVIMYNFINKTTTLDEM